jgi:hypothetical protein
VLEVALAGDDTVLVVLGVETGVLAIRCGRRDRRCRSDHLGRHLDGLWRSSRDFGCRGPLHDLRRHGGLDRRRYFHRRGDLDLGRGFDDWRGRDRGGRLDDGVGAGRLRRGGGCGCLLRRLASGLRLLGLDVALETLLLGLATHTVGLSFLDARGVALHADAERDAQVERLLVGEAELLGELMDSDLSCHVRGQPFVGRVSPPGRGPGADKSLRFSWSFPNSAPRSARTASAPTVTRSARSNARRR